ncbi:MAG: MaoC family dehydratase [Crocinitomicaceae bacterium]|jgi:3-hydroxybutyryl-CoA dehydratase|nr:MaoC family dehydratase [Crocinitomicaceae bacterium]MCF8410611.1 MaoC family dehydratase [Crocinitomicaceae bacterium]MCF8444070.1 MaoC family dehydratase [Crocinitomicaceae bacterium]
MIKSTLPKIGDFASNKMTYTSEMVKQFAELVGDKNPVHLSEEYASKTIFKKPLVHGILVTGQLSNLIASELPGPGSVYIFQDLNFKHPVHHGDTIICRAEVVEVKENKNVVLIEAVLKNQNDETVIFGKSVIKIM